MEHLKNQVVMINGISYFITDDITGLDLNTDLISNDDQNHELTFIQNACENPQDFDLTDEFFGVIEGLPAKPKVIYSKGADNIPGESSIQDVVHTTIPVTFDLTDIEKPLSSDELSSSIQKPHAVVHKQAYNINTKDKNQYSDRHSSEPVIITVKPKGNTLPSLKKDELNRVENRFTISYNTKIQTSTSTAAESEQVPAKKLESNNLLSQKVPFFKSREASGVKEQASFLSSFSDGSQLADTQKNRFGNILSAESEILKPLGSSENPIQLIQKGAKFHSLQPLSQEQLQQVAAILRQQNRKDLLKNTENIVFDKKTNTKIVCKIVYPESASIKKKGRRLKMSPVPVEDENKDVDEKATDMLKIKRTRYGRLSKPPRHVVKGLKRFSKLDEEGNEDESSDGECTEEEITPTNQPIEALPDIPVKKKRKICTNYRCLTCGKVYLGINKLAKHYCQNPDHGTFEQHLEHIAKNPLYTQDLPANVKGQQAEPIIQIPKLSSNRQPVESEEIDSDPVVEALRPKSRKRGRPRKDDGHRKICVQKHNLITAAAPLTTFDTYMTLIPRLVEIEPFQHLVSCAKAKRLLESQSGSVVPFVLVEVEKLLKDLRDFLDSLLSDEELPDHERIKVSSEIIRQCCQLDDCMYYLKDGNKNRPSKHREVNEYDEHPSLQTVEVSESVADRDEDEQSNEEASKSQSGKVDDIDNESEGSISNLFISNQKEVKDNEANVSYFKLDRTSEPEKATHHSVFDLFTERKESLSINDLHVDTAALRQVDDIVDQVASEAGEVVSPASDYQNPHSVPSYRNSPVNAPNSSKNDSSTFKSPNNQNNTDVKSEKRSHEDAEDLNKTNMLSNIQVAKDNNPFVNIETLQKTDKEPLPTLLRLDYCRDSRLEDQEHNLYTNSFSQLTEDGTDNSKVDGDIDGPFDNSSTAADGALISLGFNSDSWWS